MIGIADALVFSYPNTMPGTTLTGTADNKIYNVYVYENTNYREISRNVKLPIPLRPAMAASLGSTLENIIDNIDRKGYTGTRMSHTECRSYHTRTGMGAYARATAVEAHAEWSVFSAVARGPTAAVGVHAGILTGVSAHLSLEVVKAHVQVAGVDIGVGINVLSKGASMSWTDTAMSLAILGSCIGLSSGSGASWPSLNVSLSLL